MEGRQAVICRQIYEHPMYYSGVQHDFSIEWVDDPRSALIFGEPELAEKTLYAIRNLDETGYSITLVPITFIDNDDEETEEYPTTDS